MTVHPLAVIDRSVRRARHRLLAQQLCHSTAISLTIALGLGLLWFLAEPWLLESPPAWLRWSVLGALAGLAIVLALVHVLLRAPSRAEAALELDRRFGLRERVTTVLDLDDAEQSSPAGQAVVADAVDKVSGIAIAERFPLRPDRSLLGVPVAAALLGVTFFFYDPDTRRLLGADDSESAEVNTKASNKAADQAQKPLTPFTRQRGAEQLDRKKSAELEKLEQELDQMMEKWAREAAETDEKKREKVTELTAMEEKLRKFKEQEYKKLSQLEKQLEQLDRLSREKEFEDGPMKEFQKALSQGDLKKAEEAVDELKKKIREKKLTEADLNQLNKQIEKMKEEAQKAAKNQEKMDALRKKIDQAKREGKDAEGLERELEKLASEMKESSQMMERLAERMDKMKKAMETGDMQQMEQELDGIASELKNIDGELKDLEDADDYLQRLKEEMKKACEACKGKKSSDELGNNDDAEWSPETNPASGRRKENRDARTNSKDERISGLFDPRGKKSYGGSVKGPAFTKRTSTELGQDIQQAVQEAPQSVDVQRLPRDAQTGVKEYFEKIGRTEADGKR